MVIGCECNRVTTTPARVVGKIIVFNLENDFVTFKRSNCCVSLKYANVLNDLPSIWTTATNNFKQLRSEVFLRLVSDRAQFFFTKTTENADGRK